VTDRCGFATDGAGGAPMAQAMVTAGEINAAAVYKPTGQVRESTQTTRIGRKRERLTGFFQLSYHRCKVLAA